MLECCLALLLTCVLYQAIRERRKMGVSLVIYLIVLIVDLMVGGAIIVWKCVLTHDEDECALATGGTVGSVIVWLVLMLAFPFCAIQCSVQDRWHSLREMVKRLLEKMRPRPPRNIYIQSEIYLPTTLSLMDQGSRLEYIKGGDRRKRPAVPDSGTDRLVPREARIGDVSNSRQDTIYVFDERASVPIYKSKVHECDEA